MLAAATLLDAIFYYRNKNNKKKRNDYQELVENKKNWNMLCQQLTQY